MKILMVRFSSFGDVTQSLSVPSALTARFPGAEVHWVVRSDLAPLLRNHPHVARIWSFDRRQGLGGLFDLLRSLRAEKFDRIYDAHNNLRSRLLCAGLRFPGDWRRLWRPPVFRRRSIKRWKRFLLFRFRINLFEQPFAGQRDLLEPLQAWGIPKFPPPAAPQLFLSPSDHAEARQLLGSWGDEDFIACAASAAHLLKRWPVAHWQKLIADHPESRFVLLGGPEDRFFEEIVAVAPDRVLNLAGRCGLTVSAAVVARSRGLVTNDTGLLHVAEQLGVRAVALMGPAPFGFPCRPTTKILELDLSCRPCSKHGQGPCVNDKHQRCLVDITPGAVGAIVARWHGRALEAAP
ncbi:MAG: glycosyltransferase family 9 protein [Bdellovibrionaceae bacterium]|nr:glycosyltransferase family 9 protein [Pseudobdellovibrionaceae bacterium]MBX3033354.1 glycosyltransferase family 9 protein [Pseudobdellovibrionaceae bacterium]